MLRSAINQHCSVLAIWHHYALLNHLTPVFVLRNLRKMSENWFENDCTVLCLIHKGQTLLQNVISSYIARHFKNSTTFEAFIEQKAGPCSLFAPLDALFFKECLKGTSSVWVYGDARKIRPQNSKNLFNLGLWCLLEQSLAKEIGDLMHH